MIKVKSRGINDINLYMFVAKNLKRFFFFYNNQSDMCRPLLYCENIIILKIETPNYWHHTLSYFFIFKRYLNTDKHYIINIHTRRDNDALQFSEIKF